MLNLDYKIVTKSEFSLWLENYYLDWQKQNGRASQRKFSHWLGIHYSLVNQWMNGKGGKPGQNNLAKLAFKIGPEVYEVLNIPPPPEFIQKLEAIYDELTPDQRQSLKNKISDILNEYLDLKE